MMRMFGCVTIALLLSSAANPPSPTAAPAARKAIKVVFLGDSITAGYGVEKDQAYPTLIETSLAAKNLPITAINAGISGSTSAGGPARLKWLLRSDPDLLFLQLGANDALRGQDVSQTKKNLKNTIDLAQTNGVRVVLVGMKIPQNYGREYRAKFAAIYEEIAREEKVDFIPFLEKFLGAKDLVQSDGLHPNAKGHRLVADELVKFLTPIIAELHTSKQSAKN